MEAPITALPSPAHLAEATWPHPTRIQDPQPGSCSWAGPQGTPADMMSLPVCAGSSQSCPHKTERAAVAAGPGWPQVQVAGKGAGGPQRPTPQPVRTRSQLA